VVGGKGDWAGVGGAHGGGRRSRDLHKEEVLHEALQPRRRHGVLVVVVVVVAVVVGVGVVVVVVMVMAHVHDQRPCLGSPHHEPRRHCGQRTIQT
jgi:hypothetical protein